MCDISARDIFEAWKSGAHIAGITPRQYINILEEHPATPDRGILCIKCKHLPQDMSKIPPTILQEIQRYDYPGCESARNFTRIRIIPRKECGKLAFYACIIASSFEGWLVGEGKFRKDVWTRVSTGDICYLFNLLAKEESRLYTYHGTVGGSIHFSPDVRPAKSARSSKYAL